MEEILEIIKIINNTYEEAYKEYKPAHLYPNAKDNFNNGYCYEYSLILKRFYYDGIIVMQNDKMHSAIMIDNKIYDVNGIRNDAYNFHVADGCDFEYIYKYYGFMSIPFKDYLNSKIVKQVYKNCDSYVKKRKNFAKI